ncbi:hypothetical protein, partial [Accumulibacter sp.]|uniref:hypothetical protein n=1 Tax=Accumulibacter sp. TaxID=2053492 RepID=UPI00262802C8
GSASPPRKSTVLALTCLIPPAESTPWQVHRVAGSLLVSICSLAAVDGARRGGSSASDERCRLPEQRSPNGCRKARWQLIIVCSSDVKRLHIIGGDLEGAMFQRHDPTTAQRSPGQGDDPGVGWPSASRR